MLYNTRELEGHQLAASDGDIGKVQDFYFDDKTWVVRYLVANTGSWLTGRQVLIAPHVFGDYDREAKVVHVNLTRAQIERCPPIEAHKPVSRQYEADYYEFYGLPPYWDGSAVWGWGAFPVIVPPTREDAEPVRQHHHRDDKHLQSARSLMGCAIHASDGEVGAVKGLMVDDRSWAVRELCVETGHWYAGKEIYIAPDQVQHISYADSKVYVGLTRAEIERAAPHQVVHAASPTGRTEEFPKE